MGLRNFRLVVGFLGAIVALVNCQHAFAAVVLIDLNELGGSGGPGGTWNTYNAPANVNGSTVVDSSGQATPITLSLLAGSTTADSGNSGSAGVFNPLQLGYENLPAWVAAGGNGSAGGDYFFTSTTNGTFAFTLVFGGLTAGNVFSLDLLASRNDGNATGNFDYSLDNGATWTGFKVLNADGTVATTDGWNANTTATQMFSLLSQGYSLHRYMNASDILLTGTTLRVRTTDNATGGYSAINAIRLTVVPEPSTYLLGVATLTGLAICRRARERKCASAKHA